MASPKIGSQGGIGPATLPAQQAPAKSGWFGRGSYVVNQVPVDLHTGPGLFGKMLSGVRVGPCAPAPAKLSDREATLVELQNTFGKGKDEAVTDLLNAARRALVGTKGSKRHAGTAPAVPADVLKMAAAEDSPYRKALLALGATEDALTALHSRNGDLTKVKEEYRDNLVKALTILILGTGAFSSQGSEIRADYAIYQAMTITQHTPLVKKAFADSSLLMDLLKKLSGNPNVNAELANAVAESVSDSVKTLLATPDTKGKRKAGAQLKAQQALNAQVTSVMEHYARTLNYNLQEDMIARGKTLDEANEAYPALSGQNIGEYLHERGLDWPAIGMILVTTAAHDPSYDPYDVSGKRKQTDVEQLVDTLGENLPMLMDLYTTAKETGDSQFSTPARTYFRSAMHAYNAIEGERLTGERASVLNARSVIYGNLVRSVLDNPQKRQYLDPKAFITGYVKSLGLTAAELKAKFEDQDKIIINEQGQVRFAIPTKTEKSNGTYEKALMQQLAMSIRSGADIQAMYKFLRVEDATSKKSEDYRNLCNDLAVALMSMVGIEEYRALQIVAQERNAIALEAAQKASKKSKAKVEDDDMEVDESDEEEEVSGSEQEDSEMDTDNDPAEASSDEESETKSTVSGANSFYMLAGDVSDMEEGEESEDESEEEVEETSQILSSMNERLTAVEKRFDEQRKLAVKEQTRANKLQKRLDDIQSKATSANKLNAGLRAEKKQLEKRIAELEAKGTPSAGTAGKKPKATPVKKPVTKPSAAPAPKTAPKTSPKSTPKRPKLSKKQQLDAAKLRQEREQKRLQDDLTPAAINLVDASKRATRSNVQSS
ncbi:hypothetical protein [Parendozoicomonas haliclonae]|uniref:Uncharacterized protein n=1 Tax=Parendozoicomonas haliclonae TaxID=1960125 RepID=A0A1X7AHM9_9GAMM|nr:hypothetical protein [Parendozoicomonas haliclonae]SMA41858.1 hypothetical protein EHSB41UT_01344 [Parendozoicomonas haliclonae]